MNFASLLKQHENRHNHHNSANQIKINCNMKNQNIHPMMMNINSNGIKRKFIDNHPVQLIQMYQKFQQDPSTQWILQIQNYRLKLHKFKPSKVRTKKTQINPIQNYKLNSVTNQNNFPQRNHMKYSNFSQENTQNLQNHHFQHLQQRKNYSPMQRLQPRNFNRQQPNQNRMIHNKLSFGEDQMWRFQSQLNQNLDSEKKNVNQNINQNIQNCVNLLSQFNQCHQNTNSHKQNKKQIIQNHNLQQKQIKIKCNKNNNQFNQLKNNEQNQLKNNQLNKDQNNEQNKNKQIIDFNLQVGMSFQQFQTNNLNKKNYINENQKIQEQIKKENNNINFNQTKTKTKEQNKEIQIKQINRLVVKSPTIKPVQSQSKQVNSHKYEPTSIKIISIQTKIQDKPINFNQNQNKRQRSPNRILCKANIKSITPEKIKIPNVQSKIYSNLQIKQNIQNIQLKNKTQINIKNTQNIQNVQNVEKYKKNQTQIADRIKKIVIFDNNKNEQNKQIIQKIKLTDPIQYKNNVNLNKIQENSSMLIKNIQNTNLLVPNSEKLQFRSPVQVRPKVHNQLANLQNNISQTSQKMNMNFKVTNEIPKPLVGENNIKYLDKKTITNNNIKTQNMHNQINKPSNENGSYCNIPNYVYKPLGINNIGHTQIRQQKKSTYQPYQPNIASNNSPQQINRPSTYAPAPYFVQNAIQQNTQINKQFVYQPYNEKKYQINSVQPNINIVAPNMMPINITPNPNNINLMPVNLNINNNLVSAMPSNNYIKPIQNYNYPVIQYNEMNKIANNMNQAQQKVLNQAQQKVLNYNLLNKPSQNDDFLKVHGIKQVQSRIYQAININNIKSDPKQTSVQFSLRIDQPFEGLKTQVKDKLQ